MRIKRVVLRNWLRYRGQHEIDFEAGVYAVVARHDDDEGRSNWLGKTSLLNAIRFALYGSHPKRTEDEWITNDEASGGVQLHLDDGTLISRERRRGKSTQLTAMLAGQKQSNQKVAQEQITTLVGLSESDFLATCFFEQKQMARLITAKPAERMDIVAAWLDLDPLQRCEENVRERLSKLSAQDATLSNRAASYEARITEHIEAAGVKTLDEVDKRLADGIDALEIERDRLKKIAEEKQAERDEVAGWEQDATNAEEYGRVVEQGVALKAKIDDVDVDELRAKLDKAQEKKDASLAGLSLTNTEVQRLRTVALGEFDGKCPVLLGLGCPATKEINDSREQSAATLKAAEERRETSHHTLEDDKAALDEVFQETSQAERSAEKLVQLRTNAKRLKPSADRIEEDGAPPTERPDPSAAHREANEKEVELRVATKAREELSECSEKLVEVKGEREKLAEKLAVHREALVIFGRNGAQRRVAEHALSEMERGANELLADAGVDLSIEVLWAREGQGLATHCDACGAPYPSSQRVKKCERCDAPRGPKSIDRLDIEPSDRSGAADDLAGVAFQLSAGRWLRDKRDTQWSVACIDEPFGALDPTNRHALSTHLAVMLKGRYGFEQSFVVAHDKGIMDALPDRVEILADEKSSRFA